MCVWHFAPGTCKQQREAVFRAVVNCDEAGLLGLFATGRISNPPLIFTLSPLADIVHEQSGQTLLHQVFCSAPKTSANDVACLERVCRLLVHPPADWAGLSPCARDLLGRTPLHTLALSGWGNSPWLCRLVQVLLDLGADPEAPDGGGFRAHTYLREKADATNKELLKREEEALAPTAAAEQEELQVNINQLREQQGEQIRALSLLRPQEGGVPPGLKSPVRHFPGIFLASCMKATFAVLLVPTAPESQGFKIELNPAVPLVGERPCKQALEGCETPGSGFKVACAFGPFLGTQGPLAAKVTRRVWDALCTGKGRLGRGDRTGGGSGAVAFTCLASCRAQRGGGGGGGDQDASCAPGGGACYPGECAFHALAAAYTICQERPLKVFSAAGSGLEERWKQCHVAAKAEFAAQWAAEPAAAASATTTVIAPSAWGLTLTDLGEAMKRHGRGYAAALAAAATPSTSELKKELCKAGLVPSGEAGAPLGPTSWGSPPRPLNPPRTLRDSRFQQPSFE